MDSLGIVLCNSRCPHARVINGSELADIILQRPYAFEYIRRTDDIANLQPPSPSTYKFDSRDSITSAKS